ILYHVQVKTGDVSAAGTDATVTLTIYGSRGDTGSVQLMNDDSGPVGPFERDFNDNFTFIAPVIDQIERIKIGHDNTGTGPGWFLDKVTIDIPSEGRRYEFVCNRWLATNKDDGLTVGEFQLSYSEGNYLHW
ncbi:hypothetical protein LOTGIDRAFT_141911, partial [Lottia gigantea]